MKKKIRMRAAAILIAAVMMICGGTTVFAAYSTTIGTKTGFETVSIDKYLVMDQSATVPNAAFTYTITAGDEKEFSASAGTTRTVLAGVNAQKITMTGSDVEKVETTNETTDTSASYTLKFHNSDEAVSNDQYGGSLSTYDSKTQQYAKKTLNLDFTACEFQEPGIYRYKLTESSSNQGIETCETSLTKWIDVYVEDASTSTENKLEITAYAVYTSDDTIYESSTGTGVKSGSFTSLYNTSNLTFRKEVSGNQASKDKYFKFTVRIDGAVANTQYQVDVQSGADLSLTNNSATNAEYKNSANSEATLTASSQCADCGKYYVEATYYLHHGQEITIKGLAEGTTWTVVEYPEDYTSKPNEVTDYKDGTPADSAASSDVSKAISGTIGATNQKTSFLNERNGTIPTGIILTIAPFAAAVLIGGAGLVMILMKKRKARES